MGLDVVLDLALQVLIDASPLVDGLSHTIAEDSSVDTCGRKTNSMLNNVSPAFRGFHIQEPLSDLHVLK